MTRIPANVDQPDTLIAGLTGRQLAILSITGLGLYAAWSATHAVVPTLVFMALAIPIGATAAILALGQRDGLSLDRLLVAALRQRLQPRHQVAAPEGVRPAPAWLTSRISHTHDGDQTGDRALPQISPAPLRLPADGVTETGSGTGVIDLGTDGLALVAVCSTVNFALRTPVEQDAVVAAFGRYLHSLTAPVQVLIRAEGLDLSAQINGLRDTAGGLPHPALERAAREHADYLDQLRRTTDLLRRQVLLVLREPVHAAGPTGLDGASTLLAGLTTRRPAHHPSEVDDTDYHAAQARLARRLTEAVDLLRPAGITVTPLDTGQATAVLAACCDPDSLIPPSAGLAGAEDVITGVLTTTPVPDPDLARDEWDDPRADEDTETGDAETGDEQPSAADTATATRWGAGPFSRHGSWDHADLGGRRGSALASDIDDAFTRRDAR